MFWFYGYNFETPAGVKNSLRLRTHLGYAFSGILREIHLGYARNLSAQSLYDIRKGFGEPGDINIIQMTGSGGGVLLRLGPLGPQDGHLDNNEFAPEKWYQ